MARSISKSFNFEAFEEYLSVQEAMLPELAEVTKVSSRVIRILGSNPGKFQLQGTNTFIVGTGHERILIDTGEGRSRWIKTLTQVLSKENISIKTVLLTHWHGDHTLGVPALLETYPNLTSSIYKNQPDSGQHDISDNQTFSVEGATVKAIFSPGHAKDHMCFILSEENAMFTGDNVLGHGITAVEDMAIYMSSLSKLQAQNCSIGYPGHGETISDLPGKIQEYLEQKQRREQMIIKALRGIKNEQKGRGKGSVAVKDLVFALHGDVGTEIHETVLEPMTTEVLGKLAVDCKVGFEMKGATKRWFLRKEVT